MKKILCLALFAAALAAVPRAAHSQAIKINLPYTLLGSPNIGAEVTVSQQLAINADFSWTPYIFKTRPFQSRITEDALRIMQVTGEVRYYVKPRYYYTNDMFDGFYVGPYVMYGMYNVGFATHKNPLDDKRYVGWGISGGASIGYKFYLSRRFRLDLNVGIGLAHLQHDIHTLGADYAMVTLARDKTMLWFGPTKFGAHLVFNIFR
ncbi:MAG: DUF3575 domain-containing protein [Alistipes sp.]|jgi:hypothetical protein|nr:DUF3575 domain-containing protein [Alistipes sp.]